ncbi:sigma-54-dependent Fis family transcriptional regulator, partial [Escherichia coli]|nr:sigma-54-dependent Fis family transcriptional regulator [Escherichia coli]
ISEKACSILLKRSWPGNVRMLENTIVRSMIMQERDGPLENIAYDEECPELFPESSTAREVPAEQLHTLESFASNGDLVSQVAQFEQHLITRAL